MDRGLEGGRLLVDRVPAKVRERPRGVLVGEAEQERRRAQVRHDWPHGEHDGEHHGARDEGTPARGRGGACRFHESRDLPAVVYDARRWRPPPEQNRGLASR
jgi:hypothetical protein